jgi:hypothetical protein
LRILRGRDDCQASFMIKRSRLAAIRSSLALSKIGSNKDKVPSRKELMQVKAVVESRKVIDDDEEPAGKP